MDLNDYIVVDYGDAKFYFSEPDEPTLIQIMEIEDLKERRKEIFSKLLEKIENLSFKGEVLDKDKFLAKLEQIPARLKIIVFGAFNTAILGGSKKNETSEES